MVNGELTSLSDPRVYSRAVRQLNSATAADK